MPVKLAISAGALILLLGSIAPANAQREPQERKEEGKSQRAQHEEHANKPAARPQQTYGGGYHGGVKPTEASHGGVHPSGVPQHQGQARSGFVQSRATSWKNEHRTWQQRGGYNGYRVPEDRFRNYFGHDHFFHIGGLPMYYVGGYPRFQYDGYWVTFMDPWPEDWAPTWFESDDVYIDYTGDGYYLYDRAHPGVGVAVTIAF